jgi:Histidine kinase-like ATPase domain
MMDIHEGGCWRLPPDKTCASTARSLLQPVLTWLGLPRDQAQDVQLMASELAANALVHGLTRIDPAHSDQPASGQTIELWTWTRVRPAPQLVVAVYDPWPHWPDPDSTGRHDPIAENGRGLRLVQELSAGWSRHRTLSRLAPHPTPGKIVRFAVPTPLALGTQPHLPAAEAAEALYARLSVRGISRLQLSHGADRSLISLPSGITLWSENPGTYRWRDPCGTYQYRPHTDLIDTAETAIAHHQDLLAATRPPQSHPRPDGHSPQR